MWIFYPSSVFLRVFVLCSLLSSIAGLTVKYSRVPVTKMEGHSLTLKCSLLYEKESCDDIQATWCFSHSAEDCEPFMDPHRYQIKVNETEQNQERLRDILMTFNSLRLQDSGYYQCNAKCTISGTQGKGHLVYLNVTADPYKGLNVSKSSGQFEADTTLLTLSGILLLWCYCMDHHIV
ncbi:uncharacterized protein zgc:174945 [Xyrauchen texanus]|uniref:uncharacterized protein zgc:174945 n=1 Tax=Xyrauchen texanus TaxID=154827 RepID=UPI0022419CF6|nr:uncharacterized protein zgc:174945 [Xyrauchen texanus]